MTTLPPSEGPSPEDVLAAFTAKGFRIKAVVDTENPGMEGHPIALDHLAGGIAEALLEAKRSAHLEDARVVEQLTREKNNAYRERNQLVAFLSHRYPSLLQQHPASEEWDIDWRWIVFITLPDGQVSWHIHDSELPLFSHVTRVRPEEKVLWDGHSTAEKYARLRATALRWPR